MPQVAPGGHPAAGLCGFCCGFWKSPLDASDVTTGDQEESLSPADDLEKDILCEELMVKVRGGQEWRGQSTRQTADRSK